MDCLFCLVFIPLVAVLGRYRSGPEVRDMQRVPFQMKDALLAWDGGAGDEFGIGFQGRIPQDLFMDGTGLEKERNHGEL